MPCSTLYASPENKSSDLFCAFHPNRAIVPSLPLLLVTPEIVRPVTSKLGRPWMPSEPLWLAVLAWFARITLSGICSSRPAPNTGVGFRKITLLFASCVAKSGCASVQPVAHRPVRRDERGNEVGSAVLAGESHLGIHERAGSTDRRLRMTAGALVEIHSRSQAFGNSVYFLERILAREEKISLSLAQSGDGPAAARGSAAHSGILSHER